MSMGGSVRWPRFYRHLQKEENDEIVGAHDRSNSTAVVGGFYAGGGAVGAGVCPSCGPSRPRYGDCGASIVSVAQPASAAHVQGTIRATQRTEAQEPVRVKRELVKQEIFECLEVFYYRQRRYSTLGDQSPVECGARAAVAQPDVYKIGRGSARSYLFLETGVPIETATNRSRHNSQAERRSPCQSQFNKFNASPVSS